MSSLSFNRLQLLEIEFKLRKRKRLRTHYGHCKEFAACNCYCSQPAKRFACKDVGACVGANT